MGKGSVRRPAAISPAEEAAAWERVFGQRRVLEGESYRVVTAYWPAEAQAAVRLCPACGHDLTGGFHAPSCLGAPPAGG